MRKYENSPIVISGPSGSGKSELVTYIENNYPVFSEAIGMTTREKRKNEVGKINFVSKNEFENMIKSDVLIEYCIYNDNYYGIPKSEFNKLNDYRVIFNVGYSSAKEIKKTYHNTDMIYLLPPSNEELLRRLGDRNKKRYLLGMKETIENALKYDFLLISATDDFEKITSDFFDIIDRGPCCSQKRLILAKNKDFVNNFYRNR